MLAMNSVVDGVVTGDNGVAIVATGVRCDQAPPQSDPTADRQPHGQPRQGDPALCLRGDGPARDANDGERCRAVFRGHVDTAVGDQYGDQSFAKRSLTSPV